MEWWPVTLTDWVAIGSGLATTVLVIIVGFQLSIMKKETESRLRPWVIPVKIVPGHVTLEDGGTWGYDETMKKMANDSTIHLDIIHYKIVFINSGTIPAKISYTLIGQKEKFSKDAFENKSISNSITMVPNYDYSHDVNVPDKELLNGGKYYVGIAIKYTVDKKKFHSGAIYEISSNFRVSLEDWHEKV